MKQHLAQSFFNHSEKIEKKLDANQPATIWLKDPISGKFYGRSATYEDVLSLNEIGRGYLNV